MAALLHLLVRSVHVLGMALLVGGAAFTWGYLRWVASSGETGLAVAAGYEWLFWTALGTMVVTGVGNLGALAPAVPGPGTAWGGTLMVKLLAVLGLLLGSAVRTLLVDRVRTAPATLTPWYGATAAYLVGLLALAEVLAHG